MSIMDMFSSTVVILYEPYVSYVVPFVENILVKLLSKVAGVKCLATLLIYFLCLNFCRINVSQMFYRGNWEI